AAIANQCFWFGRAAVIRRAVCGEPVKTIVFSRTRSMASVGAPTLSPAGQIEVFQAASARKKQGLLQCLVVSPTAARQQMLAEAAAAAGWEPVVCPDSAAA